MLTETRAEVLKPGFPWPGGKSKVADLVWQRFGNVANFIEPFAGSLAILLRRPAAHFVGGYRTETVNDVNHFLVNYWRAVAHDPEAVARYADWPVAEADLHARHRWLMRSDISADWRRKMAEDPEHYDAKIAGWWVWGQCCWIGSGWCAGDIAEKRPAFSFGNLEPGVRCNHPQMAEGRPQLADAFDIGRGVNGGGQLHAKRPNFPDSKSSPGIGILADSGASTLWQQVPELEHQRGVNAIQLGTCDARRAWLTEWMHRLSDRMRLVRTCYGHWSRVCDSESTLARLGTTGVFLDPPYPSQSTDGKRSRAPSLYASDKGADLNVLRDEVLDWCIRWGSNPEIRIAVCGYERDGYEVLEEKHGWTVEAWETGGGYANQRRKGKGKSENAKRERIWFSPACINEASLFDN